MNEQQKEILVRTLASMDTGNGISAQNVFLRTAKALRLKIKPRDVSPLSECMPIIRDMMDDGILEYWHHEKTPYYTVRAEKTVRSSYRLDPAGAIIKTLNNKGNGARALELMSRRPFYVNKKMVEAEKAKAEATLRDLPQAWQDGILRGDNYQSAKVTEENKLRQYNALLALPEQAVYFDTAADYRGRLYYGGGLCSPHNGKFARKVFTAPNEKTYDCRSSFAQMITLLTGDAGLGRACGIGTEEDCDLYISIGLQAGLDKEFCEKNRDPLKYSIMPRAYGAGEEKTKTTLLDAGFTPAQAIAIVGRLDAFTRLSKRAQAMAGEWADDGDQIEWTTPCGNTPKQKYWRTKQAQFCTGDNSKLYYPPALP